MNAQKNMPPGSAQNPQAVMAAILKAQAGNGSGCNISPEVLESIMKAQKNLPPGAPLNPQALMQAVTAGTQAANAKLSLPNAALQAAIKAQADAAGSVTPDILAAVLKAQKSLPAGSTQDPQA